MLYTKPKTAIDDQINTLKNRGLIINDESFAKKVLEHISYYRLVGYWWPMQSDKVNHIFKPNSTFENVVSLYNFDKDLRLLVFDVIEKIEISFRTKLIYNLSQEFDPWWFENQNLFKNVANHNNSLQDIDRDLNFSKEVFISEHRKKYHSDTRRPPAWKTLEVVSFGVLSKLYGNLSHQTVKSKNIIAVHYGTVNHTFLPSWLQSIVQIRNLCAHHSRLWNKNLPGRPKLLPNPPNNWLRNVPRSAEHHMLYTHLCCMKYILNTIDSKNDFKIKLLSLFLSYPNIDQNALGMKPDWQYEPLWL